MEKSSVLEISVAIAINIGAVTSRCWWSGSEKRRGRRGTREMREKGTKRIGGEARMQTRRGGEEAEEPRE